MSDYRRSSRAAKINGDFLLFVGVLLGWFALQTWILPSMGVST